LPKVVDVNVIVNELAPLFELTLSEAVRIEFDFQAVQLRAEVDQSQIENALLNLVINARDAMPGGGELCIRTRQVHLSASQAFQMDELAAGHYVEICITDDGAGMSPTVLLNAIEPFYTTKSTSEGTGLGLSTVYGFAKQSGGHLSIQSELNQGTTATLYFPVSEKPLSLVNDNRTSDLIKSAQGELVLLIEDDTVIRELAFGTLKNLGYQPLAASNGREATQLVAVHKDKIRLVISDVLLAEGETGPDVVEQISAQQGGIGTIFISGHTREYWGDKHCFPEHALFLHKPFKQHQLKLAIEQLLRTL
jgi:CheY-like chemotaxis protein